MKVYELIEEIKSLDTSQRNLILQEIMKDEAVSATEILIAKVGSLERFKQDAKLDIVKVAEAGMELGEREMRSVTKIKGNTRKKTDTFKLAMVRCLLDAGAFYNTEYGKQIEAADYSSIDKDWYEWGWKPKTTTNRGETE